MSVFLDTSALLAVLDADDQFHPRARRAWADLINRAEDLVCTNYVLVETFALAQHRLGLEAVRSLVEDILPLLRVHWIGEAEHGAGVAALLTAGRRQLSLVDCTSFIVMRQLRLRTAFAFDSDFATQGFETLS
jgi:predicted nucleic acid-binding protein